MAILLPDQDDCLVSADGASANFMFGQILLAKTYLGEKNLTHGAWGSVFAIPLNMILFSKTLHRATIGHVTLHLYIIYRRCVLTNVCPFTCKFV